MLKNWVIYYVCLLATLVFALLFPGRTSSAFFYTLLALPVVSLASVLLMLAGFQYEQSLERTTAVKGDSVAYRLTLRNKNLMTLHSLRANFRGNHAIYANEFRDRAISVPPFSAVSVDIPIPCKYRGAYDVGLRQIRLSDYLGLFSFKQDVAQLGTVTVYPRILPVSGFPAMAGDADDMGSQSAKGQQSAESISDIRKYSNGDRLRSIHWKLSAKKEELMVKNFEQATGSAAELVIDGSRITGSAEDMAELSDRLVECAVSLAWHFVTRSIPVTVWLCAKRMESHPVRNANEFDGIYQKLSEANFEGGQLLPELVQELHLGGRKTVIAIATGFHDGICGLVMKARASGCMAILITVAPPIENAQTSQTSNSDNRAMLLQSGVLVIPYGAEGGLDAALAQLAV